MGCCRNSPGEAKFRRLKASNKRLNEALLKRRAGTESLLATGFSCLMEAGEQVNPPSRTFHHPQQLGLPANIVHS